MERTFENTCDDVSHTHPMKKKHWDTYDLYSYLARHLSFTVRLKINNNFSTIFSFKQESENEIRINLHRMFLNAPEEVIDAVIHMVKHPRSKTSNRIVRSFINSNYDKIEAKETQIDLSRFNSSGKHYDLAEMMEALNEFYFQRSLKNIRVAWGKASSPRKRFRRHIQFGSYDETNRIIRISPLLDSLKIPKFFVEYVVFHEMLHAKIPSRIDKNGRRIHHPHHFKLLEKQFKRYNQALALEKEIFDILNQ